METRATKGLYQKFEQRSKPFIPPNQVVMSANDDFSLHDDEELSLHDDASLNGSAPASNKGDAPAKPPQIITTNTLSNIKLFKLPKRGHQRQDGFLQVHPPTTQENSVADEKEGKQEHYLLIGCIQKIISDVFMAWMMPKRSGQPSRQVMLNCNLNLGDQEAALTAITSFSTCPSNDCDGAWKLLSLLSSTHYSTCQSNDSDGEPGTVSDHSVNDDPVSTQKTQPKVPTPTQTVDPSCAQHVKPPRQPIKTPLTSSPIPSYKRQNWNQRMERELGAGYSFERKSCFVCGSLSHLIKDCDYYEKKMAREAVLKSKRVVHTNDRQATPAWNNTNRINKANQFNPRPVNVRPNLSTASNTFKTGRVNVNTGHGNINSGSVHVNAGTQIKSGASRFNTGKQHVNSGSVHVNAGTQIKSGASRFNTGKQHVNSDRMYVNSGTQNKSGGSRVNTGKQNVNTARVNRPVLSNQTSQVNLKSPKKCFSKQSSPVNRPFSRNTAYKSNIYAVKGKMGTAVKTSAGCVWRKTTPHSNTNGGPTPDSNVHVSQGSSTDAYGAIEIIKSKVGSVTFGGSKGSISGKGTIRLGNLVFDDVAFVKELGHFNLFSISQICDKKLNVLFTEKECFVVSSDFKMPDENQVLLKVPRQHNMYTFDMKTVDSSKGYTCLLAKASSNEAKLWHRRLGHLNFKNLNKLVKDNLVRGLPSKSFKNDHTCVACQKGKQHKASCKAKMDRYVTHPLHTLHMDLFGPTSVRSINHASYCLVITDDCSRFCWVFFLAKKDETSGILKTFIKQIENQLNQKVKIIRSDNGTEFKNRGMLEFCGEKGIKQEFSNARTPQQNGVAERMNRTLIEAARTMLADSLLPTTFWAEAVNTACYTFNRVRVTKPQNKTPYELLFGHKPILSYIRPFGCHVTILNTLSPLGKFDGKSDEGFLVGYSVNSKAFRVYNLVTKRVEVNLHVNFLEEKPNVQGLGHRWMFDLDYLTDSMNYIPVSLQNQANPAGSKEVNDIDVQTEEAEELLVVSSTSRTAAGSEHNATKKSHSSKKPSSTPISKSADDIMVFRKELDALALKHQGPVPTKTPTSTNPVNTGSSDFNTGDEQVSPGHIEAVAPSAHNVEEVFSDDDDDEMPEIRIYDKSSEGIFEQASYDDDGVITDFNNLPDEVDVITNPTLRIHNAHPQSQILGDPNTPVQTRSSLKKITEAHALLGTEIFKLNEKVKKLEDKLRKKRKSKEAKDAEGQDQEVPFETDQGDIFVTPEKSKSSGEAQEEQISPSTLEAAQILTNVASEGFKGSQAPLGSKIYKRKSKSTKTPTKILHFEEPDSAQVNTAQVNTAELNPDSTSSAQINTGEVNAAEVNTGEAERVQRRKGKEPMTEEDLQAEVQASKTSKELQELADLEEAKRVQAQKTQRQIDLDALLARRLVEQEEEAAREALATEFDYIQARLNADQILAEKIQQEEREQYTIEERAKFLHDTIAAQRKFLAEQRSAIIRNKPPTISQLRNQMITYLKHVANKKHAELKSKSFEEIQVLYERYKKQDQTFVAIGSEEDERAIKKMNEKDDDKEEEKKDESVHEEAQEEEGAKKRKLGTRRKLKAKRRKHGSSLTREDDDLKICLHISPDEDKVIDVESLDHQYPIIEWQSFFLTTKPQHDQTKPDEDIYLNKVTRSNGHQRFFRTLMGVLSILDREDLKVIYELVMEEYKDRLPEGFDRMLWGDLMIMFNQGDTADFWDTQQNWKLISWKLHSSSGVHTIMTSTGLVFHMFVENRYPLTKEVLSQMLKLKLETEEESSMALELIKFVKQQLEEFEDSNDDDLVTSDHGEEERV
ncbi:putative ribonuclease H-like domain-containing protein [Tanacetum coccineum]|uniref:Ribonuclease H-like domain-containing protein n=1 Tax=Tanacetum coccineum TaxID=301880 RepID=A0ABQ4WLN7_9ASTR